MRPHLRARAPLSHRPRPLFVATLLLVALYGGVVAWLHAHRPAGQWVGRTECSWRGDPRVRIIPGLTRVESTATVAHESVHVAECRNLGPLRYRWNTLFAKSNLALEVPAYCASVRVRLKAGWQLSTVRSTVVEDMQAAMSDQLDSATLAQAIAMGCPELQLKQDHADKSGKGG